MNNKTKIKVVKALVLFSKTGIEKSEEEKIPLI
jgi:hypothetical protein